MRSILTLSTSLLLTLHVGAQWQPMATGMFSNRSLCSDEGDLYCATFPNGVKKSAGGIGPFTAVNTGLPMTGASYFVQSVGSDGAYLYAGTESGIYRSGDGGANWNNINGSLTANATVYANKFFSIGGNIIAVFAGSIGQGGGIWRSGNFGNTWLIGHSGMGSNVLVNHVTQVGATLWASTSTGLYTSTDNAQNWTAHPSVNYSVYSLASLNNTLVIACSFGMRYSTNGGNSWLDATGDPGSPTDGELIAFDGMLFTVLNSPTGCLRSLDNGVTWNEYNTGFSEVDAQAQEEFLVVGNTLYCTALFDVYSLTGTGTDVVEDRPAPSITAFPTMFTDGFYLSGNAVEGELLLIDPSGRTVRRQFLAAGTNRFVERGALAAGTYHAMFHDRRSANRSDLGILIAH